MKQRRTQTRRPQTETTSSLLSYISRRKKNRHQHSCYISVLSASALSLLLILHYYRRTNEPLHNQPKSLLQIHSTAHLPACNAHRMSLNDVLGSPPGDKPTIYTDWQIDRQDLDTPSSFIRRYGHIPQYVKMGDALPLFDKQGKLCVTTYKVLIDTLVQRFLKRKVNTHGLPPKRATNDDILIFTNQNESPELFESILNQYSTPDPLSFTKDYINPTTHEKGWLQVFSAMMLRSAHRFHLHKEAWLGQVSGSRMWFLLPPNTPTKTLDYKPPACEYLYKREKLPDGAMMCIQNAGEVMYLPADWWHATCGLEEWNVGVGEQLGAPSMIAPVEVEERTKEEWKETLEECAEVGAFAGGLAI